MACPLFYARCSPSKGGSSLWGPSILEMSVLGLHIDSDQLGSNDINHAGGNIGVFFLSFPGIKNFLTP